MVRVSAYGRESIQLGRASTKWPNDCSVQLLDLALYLAVLSPCSSNGERAWLRHFGIAPCLS
jgi:hypothetical protein